ncbi:MAG: hypothetical protein PF542_03155 [Nanoarchaeota archaeon]|jgi:hypothetical protein|nr:hypothetical protein [Nanoarchaeota archaeon]
MEKESKLVKYLPLHKVTDSEEESRSENIILLENYVSAANGANYDSSLSDRVTMASNGNVGSWGAEVLAKDSFYLSGDVRTYVNSHFEKELEPYKVALKAEKKKAKTIEEMASAIHGHMNVIGEPLNGSISEVPGRFEDIRNYHLFGKTFTETVMKSYIERESSSEDSNIKIAKKNLNALAEPFPTAWNGDSFVIKNK